MCLGIPGKIISIEDEQKLIVKADFSGVQRNISMNCIVKSPEELPAMSDKWGISAWWICNELYRRRRSKKNS